MDTLTAIRTFAKPGFTPAKRVRIHNNKWYLVTMQNIESDPRCDYLGLGEGTYTELLPGNKARERRDAHLNHCNAIQEYIGRVFELLTNQYGGEIRHIGYFSNASDLQAKLDECKDKYDKWIADCRLEGQRHLDAASAIELGTGKSIMTAEMHRNTATECFAVANKHENGFRCDAREISR